MRTPAPRLLVELAMHTARLLATIVILLGTLVSALAEPTLAEKLQSLPQAQNKGTTASDTIKTMNDLIRQRRVEKTNAETQAWKLIRTQADWEAFREPRLTALRQSLGKGRVTTPVQSHVTGTLAGDGFVIENLLFDSWPDLWISANLYRPQKPRASMPGIIIVHSHHTPKEHGELQDMGMTWARAGCLVLVMDQLGHGERRDHPFVDAASYPRPFRVSRQDYYFRYDNANRLNLLGESLIGWMAADLMRGVDLLLTQPGIDASRIILLGSVAGGGDPCAVAAALDRRITAAVPFNFGGPQPETRYPLPDDAEASFNYAGGGSWESTRNLKDSIAGGFFPWLIVGSIAPRPLVYAHEFRWDRERDPVWTRLQSLYALYGKPEHLAFTHGRGSVTGQPPEATHCTHIGAEHRIRIHEAFRKWFQIDVTPAQEYRNRLAPEKLRCWTAEARTRLQPKPLGDLLDGLAAQQIQQVEKDLQGRSVAEQHTLLRTRWQAILKYPDRQQAGKTQVEREFAIDSYRGKQLAITSDPGITIPALLLVSDKAEKAPAVIAVASEGKRALLSQRSTEIASLLEAGLTVCLVDLRGTGEWKFGNSRSRSSSATSISSSLLMLGDPLVAGQMRDLNATISALREIPGIDGNRLAIWGDSFAKMNTTDPGTRFPRDDDSILPPQAEPMGGVLALLTALRHDSVKAVSIRGGLVSGRSAMKPYLTLLPHDAVIPGAISAGDLPLLTAVVSRRIPVRLEGTVDGSNRSVTDAALKFAFPWPDTKLQFTGSDLPLSNWLVQKLSENR